MLLGSALTAFQLSLTEMALENNIMVCEDREYRLGNDFWKGLTTLLQGMIESPWLAESIYQLLQGAERPVLRLNIAEVVFDTKYRNNCGCQTGRWKVEAKCKVSQ